MLTRCPHCATAFRVTPEQLKARAGRVRCGECQQVFNALDTLEEAITPPSPSSSVEFEPIAATENIAASETGVVPEELVAAEPDMAVEPAAETVALAAAEPTEPAPADVSPFVVDDILPQESAEEPRVELDPLPAPEALTPALEPQLHETAPKRTWPWVLAGLMTLIILLGQAIWYFRTEIVVLQPDTKPWLKDYCALLGCDLPLPRKAELIGIESSDLHPDPSGAAGRLLMSAQLRNRAPFAQEFPHLELTLTDAADQALVRRVLAPADYLPPQAPREQGFRSSADLNVHLLIETGDTPAAGYRLYLFFP